MEQIIAIAAITIVSMTIGIVLDKVLKRSPGWRATKYSVWRVRAAHRLFAAHQLLKARQ